MRISAPLRGWSGANRETNSSFSVGLAGESVETLAVELRTAEKEKDSDRMQRRREEEFWGFMEKGRENLEMGRGEMEEEE